MNATVFVAYKHKLSMMNRLYSLPMWSSLTDGPTNSVVLVLLVLLSGHVFINNPLTVSKETHSKRHENKLKLNHQDSAWALGSANPDSRLWRQSLSFSYQKKKKKKFTNSTTEDRS